MAQPEPRPSHPPWMVAFLLPSLLAILLALPPLFCQYLPAIDLPQHVVVTAILSRFHDPGLGFFDYYALRPGSLYILPYLLALGLAKLVPVKRALYAVVALTLVLYPLAVVDVTRQRRRPGAVALLALPLVYNQLFFWGFVNFDLAISLAFIGIAVWRRERPGWPTEALLLAVIAALQFTHVYGPLFLGGYIALSILVGERPPPRRLPALLLIGGGTLWWMLDMRKAPNVSGYSWLPKSDLLANLHRYILGGYQDPSELLLLLLFLLCFLLLTHASLPLTRARWRALSRPDRAVYLYVALNLLLYVALPLSLTTAAVLNLRHIVLAALLLPLVAGDSPEAPVAPQTAPQSAPRRLGRRLAWVLAGAVLLNSWGHLVLFDREARSFDAVIAAAPDRPRVVQFNLDPYGAIMANYPYVHFAAYLQAERGGLIAVSAPRAAYAMPVTFRKDRAAEVPPAPFNFDNMPGLYSERRFGYAYDHALLRSERRPFVTSPKFPFELVLRHGYWQLYRRVSIPPETPGPRH